MGRRHLLIYDVPRPCSRRSESWYDCRLAVWAFVNVPEQWREYDCEDYFRLLADSVVALREGYLSRSITV